MKDRLEKLFFAIVRILFFVLALLAIVTLIGAGIYLSKLYYDSFPKQTKEEIYIPNDPNVTFDGFKTKANDLLRREKAHREHIRQYVLNVVKNGSKGHGYEIKSMPGGLIGNNDADSVAVYIANGMSDNNQPKAYGACVACHGNGEENSRAPSLKELPIYNGIRGLIDNGQAKSEVYTNYPKEQRSEYDRYIDRVLLLINKYASKTIQKGAKRSYIVKYVQNQTNKYNSKYQELFKVQLENGLMKLDSFSTDQNNFITASMVSIKPISWKLYLEWFANNFAEQVAQETAKRSNIERENELRKQEAKDKALEARAKLTLVLTVAGGALVVFILATMLLVLIRIEFNTRYAGDQEKSS